MVVENVEKSPSGKPVSPVRNTGLTPVDRQKEDGTGEALRPDQPQLSRARFEVQSPRKRTEVAILYFGFAFS